MSKDDDKRLKFGELNFPVNGKCIDVKIELH